MNRTEFITKLRRYSRLEGLGYLTELADAAEELIPIGPFQQSYPAQPEQPKGKLQEIAERHAEKQKPLDEKARRIMENA
jgi:hypothetical protein